MRTETRACWSPGASHRNTSPERTAGSAFDGHVQTLGLAGIGDVKIDDMGWVNSDTRRFGLKDPYILLVPGSSPQHPQKRWPAASYGALAQAIQVKGFQPVILGTEADAEAVASPEAEAVQPPEVETPEPAPEVEEVEPVLMDADPALKPILKQVHYALNVTLLVAVCLHLLAALKHHFIDRDGVLKRILP